MNLGHAGAAIDHNHRLASAHSAVGRQTPATAKGVFPGRECQVRVMRPFSPSASAHAVTGIRQRRCSKLSLQNAVCSLSSRAFVTGFGFSGRPCFPFNARGKPQVIEWVFRAVTITRIDFLREVYAQLDRSAEQLPDRLCRRRHAVQIAHSSRICAPELESMPAAPCRYVPCMFS